MSNITESITVIVDPAPIINVGVTEDITVNNIQPPQNVVVQPTSQAPIVAVVAPIEVTNTVQESVQNLTLQEPANIVVAPTETVIIATNVVPSESNNVTIQENILGVTVAPPKTINVTISEGGGGGLPPIGGTGWIHITNGGLDGEASTPTAADVGADPTGSASAALAAAGVYTDSVAASKADKVTISPATGTKVTVNAQGIVTNVSNATTADVNDSTDRRYVTDTEKTTISNTSGTNTGDETATTIKNKLGITTLSGSNTGDQDLSGLVPKTTTVNNKALTTNITLTPADIGADVAGSAATVQTNLDTHAAAIGTAVHGLGTAATHAATDFDSAGSANTVQSNLNTHAALTTSAHGGIVSSSDFRLTDARTPTAHAASHTTGADQIADATPTTHGLESAADKAKLDAITGTNTGDETTATIKSKLGISVLSGSNTGDQDLSGVVPKTTTVNNKALSSNITITASDVGLGNVPNTDFTADILRSKLSLATGVLTGCVLSINGSDSTKIDVSAGTCLYVDDSDPTNPVSEILTVPLTTITPSVAGQGLDVTFLAWAGIARQSAGVGTVVFATEFSETDRRRISVLGRMWATGIGATTIAAVTNYQSPAWGSEKTLEDLAHALGGAINIDGNDFSAHTGQLTLDKSLGHAFRLYASSGTSKDSPNTPVCSAITPVTSYRYWAASGTTYGNALSATIDPNYYDSSGTKTAVPAGKWTIQRVYYFAGSMTVAVTYGQALFDTLDAAKAAANTQVIAFSDLATRMFHGGLLRARVYVQQGMTDLSGAYVERMTAFVGGGAGSGGGTVADHAALAHLDYASSGHTGFVPSIRKITSTIDLSADRNLTYSDVGADAAGSAAAAQAASLPLHGTADAVTGATFTKTLTVDTGNVTIHGNVANTSALTLGAGSSSLSGSSSGTNTGDETAASIESKLGVSAGNVTALASLSGTNTGDQTLPTDATIVTSDVTTNNASTSKHGWQPKAVAPAAGQLNVVAIANAETTTSYKTIIGSTVPSTQAFGDAASHGSSLEAAAADHKHAMPAAPTASSIGLGSVTNDAQTKAAIVPNTTPSAGQILVGNAGGTAYAPVSLTGAVSITSTGATSLAAATASTLGGVKPDGTSILNTAGAISATAASVGALPSSTTHLSGDVAITTTVNGHALSSNVTVTATDVSLGNVTNDAQVKRTEMGVANGVATLDSGGKVPTSQLPSLAAGSTPLWKMWVYN